MEYYQSSELMPIFQGYCKLGVIWSSPRDNMVYSVISKVILGCLVAKETPSLILICSCRILYYLHPPICLILSEKDDFNIT